ncbi:MAG: EF-hand domain-containing protein [Sphingomonadales bacterium]|nr:MAG: EF-hand domain-containing protein [Sphingomonadales bacterium]
MGVRRGARAPKGREIKGIGMTRAALGVIAGALLAWGAAPAFAQTPAEIVSPSPAPVPPEQLPPIQPPPTPTFPQEQTADVDRIDRVSGAAPGPTMRAPEGVKVVAPGALIYASFDRNFDGVVTLDEMEAGAGLAFDVADKNRDGFITGFEQADWAARMGATGDVMANAMTFDIDLDRQVTRAEFIAGFKRLAGQINASGDLTFNDLVRPLSRPGDQASSGR